MHACQAKAVALLEIVQLLVEQGTTRDSAAGRQALARQIERRRLEEATSEYDGVRRGWCLGGEEIRQELLASAADRVGGQPLRRGAARNRAGEGPPPRARGTPTAQGRGWKEKDLAGWAKGDKSKVALARRLRQETTMSLKWIAQRLQMGSWTYVSNLLRKK
jgi:hypothetical protein